jgi:hypothetical protein
VPTIPELDHLLRDRVDAFLPAARGELLHVPMLPDFERAGIIGEYWGQPEDAILRGAAHRPRGGSDGEGVVVGMLRQAER